MEKNQYETCGKNCKNPRNLCHYVQRKDRTGTSAENCYFYETMTIAEKMALLKANKKIC